MLRTNSAAVSDPESVSSTISSAISMLDLGHSYAEMGILRFCPDYVFLHLLYSAVYLLKVKVSRDLSLISPRGAHALCLGLQHLLRDSRGR